MADDIIIITLTGVPRSKLRPRFGRLHNGASVAFTDTKTREYEGDLRSAATAAMNGRLPLTGPLELSLRAVFQVPGSWSKKRRRKALGGLIAPVVKPDWNNLGGPLDALNAIVWEDDKQVVQARVLKVYGERPGITIEIKPVITKPYQVDLEDYIGSLGRRA